MKSAYKKFVALMVLLACGGTHCVTLVSERGSFMPLGYEMEEFYEEEPEIVYRTIGHSDFGFLCREAGKE